MYLDPHTAQPFVDVTAPGESDESYHCRYASRMRIADVDPSMALVSVIVLKAGQLMVYVYNYEVFAVIYIFHIAAV